MAIYSGYTGAKSCTRGPATGAKGAMAWFIAAYADLGGRNSGIYNCRSVRGSTRTTSLHGEGRAMDFGLKWASQIPAFEIFAEQLRLNSAELGIQCIIFNGKIFSGGYSNKGWQRYTGVNPHTDHLHVEFSWAAANRGLDETVALWDSELRGKITAEVKPQGGKKPATPKVTKYPTDYKNLRVDGAFGKLSIEALQILMRAVGHYNRSVDGSFGYYTIIGLQKWLRSLGYYTRAIDGDFGTETVKALQRFLRKKGLYPAGYRIDGDFGSFSVKAFQKYLNKQNGR